jgi:hypothetical protein
MPEALECGGSTPLCFPSQTLAFIQSGVEPTHSKAFGACDFALWQ